MSEPTLTKEQLAFVKRSLAAAGDDGPLVIPFSVLRQLVEASEWAMSGWEYMGTAVDWKGIKEALAEHDALCASNSILRAENALLRTIDCVIEQTNKMKYDEIADELRRLPMTWYPELLRIMVTSAVAKNVFLPGGAARFVKGVEDSLPVSSANRETTKYA